MIMLSPILFLSPLINRTQCFLSFLKLMKHINIKQQQQQQQATNNNILFLPTLSKFSHNWGTAGVSSCIIIKWIDYSQWYFECVYVEIRNRRLKKSSWLIQAINKWKKLSLMDLWLFTHILLMSFPPVFLYPVRWCWWGLWFLELLILRGKCIVRRITFHSTQGLMNKVVYIIEDLG